MPLSSRAVGSCDPGEAETAAAVVPARRDDPAFLRVALRPSDRARCSAGPERRGGGAGGEPALSPPSPGAAKIVDVRNGTLSALALLAVAGDDGLMGDPPAYRTVSKWLEDLEVTRERRSHCTAASRCHGNLGSPCWQLMSSALQ